MLVSLYGQRTDFDAINAIADKLGLSVMEDGAQRRDVTGKGRKPCGLGTIGSIGFSLRRQAEYAAICEEIAALHRPTCKRSSKASVSRAAEPWIPGPDSHARMNK